MRKRAAAEGCDAVILTGTRNTVVGNAVQNADGTGLATLATLEGREGVCIVYADRSARR